VSKLLRTICAKKFACHTHIVNLPCPKFRGSKAPALHTLVHNSYSFLFLIMYLHYMLFLLDI